MLTLPRLCDLQPRWTLPRLDLKGARIRAARRTPAPLGLTTGRRGLTLDLQSPTALILISCQFTLPPTLASQTATTWAGLLCTLSTGWNGTQTQTHYRRLRRVTTSADMHMPGTTLVWSARDVVLQTIYPAVFRFMERRWNAYEAMALFVSLGGAALLRVGHLLDHRRSMGARFTESPRTPLLALTGCQPLARLTGTRDFVWGEDDFFTFAVHSGAPGGSASDTRATAIRVTAHTLTQFDSDCGVRIDDSPALHTEPRYAPRPVRWFDRHGPVDYEHEILVLYESQLVSQWSSSVPITYIHRRLMDDQDYADADRDGFPFDTIQGQGYPRGHYPDVTLINGTVARCIGVVPYMVIHFCDAYGEEVQYHLVLHNVPVVNFNISNTWDSCLFCVGNDVLDDMGWSYNPHVNTSTLPSQQAQPWEPQRRPVPAELQQGALQLTPRDRPGQVFLVPCGPAFTEELPPHHITLKVNSVEEYLRRLGVLICFTGAPYRPSSLSVLHNMTLFELLALRPDMPFAPVTYSCDTSSLNANGEAMWLREQHQHRDLSSHSTLFSTHGTVVGWMEGRQGQGEEGRQGQEAEVRVGLMPIRQGELAPRQVCPLQWDAQVPPCMDFFGLHSLIHRALPGDVDYERPPSPYPCIEPPGPIEYAQEVAAAAQAQRRAPPPNYLT